MLIMSPSMVLAEGTAELIPSGSSSSCISYVQGNDGAGKMGPSYHQAATEYIYVHISNPLTETIYYGFTRKLPTNKHRIYLL